MGMQPCNLWAGYSYILTQLPQFDSLGHNNFHSTTSPLYHSLYFQMFKIRIIILILFSDINECAEAVDDLCLAADTVCHNTEGSFKCVP